MSPFDLAQGDLEHGETGPSKGHEAWTTGGSTGGGGGTQYSTRWQLSHCTIESLCLTCWNTGGRRRTWQTEQSPSRVALQMATPLRAFATCSNNATSLGSSAFTSAARASVDSFSEASVETRS